jgi:hypothetical protein
VVTAFARNPRADIAAFMRQAVHSAEWFGRSPVVSD